MKLKEYIKNLQDVLYSNPEYAELEVITANDSEGNGFDPVFFEQSLGNLGGGEFTQVENFDELDKSDQVINAICVN